LLWNPRIIPDCLSMQPLQALREHVTTMGKWPGNYARETYALPAIQKRHGAA